MNICKYDGCKDEVFISKSNIKKGFKKEDMLFCKKHCRVCDMITFTIKYGKDEAKKKYKEMLERRKKSKTLEGMIEKYGEECGLKRWKNYCIKQGKRNTLQGKIECWGDEIGRKKWEEQKEKCGVSTRREYFLEESQANYDMADYLLSKRQSTFSLDKCIKKYGEIKGKRVWKDRQEKWQNKLKGKPQEEIEEINRKKIQNIDMFIERYGKKLGKLKYKEFNKKRVALLYSYTTTKTSKICSSFIDVLEKKLNIKIQKEVNIGPFFVDGLLNNVVIEFYGDYWHCNPKVYEDNYINSRVGKTAKQIWNRDKKRKEYIKSKGFDFIEIWESEWSKNKKNVIERIKNVL